jgi:hypothetical protein
MTEAYLPTINAEDIKPVKAKKNGQNGDHLPPNLGKAVRLPVVDFSDPNRPPTCLEVDFPIAPVNALSQLEQNAGKPVYQMSKWFARRRSSIFRSMLIAAAVESPEDPRRAAKLVWDHYYANHQKAGHFKKLKVLDLFMGGGPTLIEGSRLGFQVTGVDLNPIAWFVCRNEMSCSDPKMVKAFFAKIEEKVKPVIQPFYTTTCPRGHEGKWVEKTTGVRVDIDPLDCPADQRCRYEWQGPEVIYTFWAKHGPCQAEGCKHRTPLFGNLVIAQKSLSASYIKTICPSCGHEFNIELGEMRMAPGVERVVLESEPSFTETTQQFGQMLNDYNRGKAQDKAERVEELLERIDNEPGMRCPKCSAFAGEPIKQILKRHSKAQSVGGIKKKDFEVERHSVQMYLLIHPDWLRGSSGFDSEKELGGYAGAPPVDTEEWFNRRLEKLKLVEVRGENLPEEIRLSDGALLKPNQGTVPGNSEFTCSKCGRNKDILESVRPTGHTAAVAPYALQCYCPLCDAEGYNYGGRYFKVPDVHDIGRISKAEREWASRRDADLSDCWPREQCWDAKMMRANGGVNDGWGYKYWSSMFGCRQLISHSQLVRSIADDSEEQWPMDVREHALGALEQHLRYCSLFSFYQQQYDKVIPHFSNANYHPKMLVSEISPFAPLGAGRWTSCCALAVAGVEWGRTPWEILVSSGSKSLRLCTEDPVKTLTSLYCKSSTDLSELQDASYDLVVTDPPFGHNIFYADLADFFYVWLRKPLLNLYEGLPEKAYFESERTPHALEVVDNDFEHPDDREEWEKDRFVRARHLEMIRESIGDDTIEEHAPNPLHHRAPAPDFYRRTLTGCWEEANRVLKPGGLLAFTFHHSEDDPWVDVLESLFDAGFIIVATYPVRSDETKGETAAFGAKRIEYDIIHVCRKRIEQPQSVAWAKMRRWVRTEGQRLKDLLEHTHGDEVPEADLRIILIGKSLEFYSRHYGEVYTGDGQILNVRDALLGIDQLIDDIFAGTDEEAQRPPAEAEPASRLFLRVFSGKGSIARDDLNKTLRGTGMDQDDFESRGWIRATGTTIHVVPVTERFEYFTTPGRTRQVIKTDLDQAFFLIGACMKASGIDVESELNRNTFTIKRSVDSILKWLSEKDLNQDVKEAAKLALDLVTHWRTKPRVKPVEQLSLFETLEQEGQ